LLKVFFFFSFWFVSLFLNAQTFSGIGDTIPDDGNSIDFPIVVSGLSPSIIDTTNFGVETVCIDLVHTYDSDLSISLIAPDGTEVILSAGNGYNGQNYINTCFNSFAPTSIVTNYAPFTGTFQPQGSLGLANNGQNGNGIWRLHIQDTYPFADWGILNNWSISFGNNPGTMFPFYSSTLPIVVINTYGQAIPDEPKIQAHMGIINNGYGIRNYKTDPFNSYNGYIGIEMRGSSSQTFPKKSYGFETWNSIGAEIKDSLLGMPSESDWCLIANYSDKTMMRNVLAYNFSRMMGHWASRTRYCEVVINGDYQGVYVLLEKIKRDDDRVNISNLDQDDIAGDSLTGGYIIKIDKGTGSGGTDGWTSSFPPAVSSGGQTINFMYEYPKSTEIQQQQMNYIQAYVDSFETVLNGNNFNDTINGYSKYISVKSFIDYFIINEISKNTDGYRLSTYLYKKRDSKGGQLHIGPVWDYDLAFWNANYCGGNDYTGWSYKFGDGCPGDYWQVPFWWNRLMQDTIFKDKLRCHWDYFRKNLLDTTYMFHYIDSIAQYINEGQTRNFKRWPILGVYVWPNPSPLATTYGGEVESLKKWIRQRVGWLDDSIPGNCYDHTSIHEYATLKENLKVYPNPVGSGLLYIDLPADLPSTAQLEIFGFTGKIIQRININQSGDNTIAILPPSSKGLYLIKIAYKNKILLGKFIKE